MGFVLHVRMGTGKKKLESSTARATCLTRATLPFAMAMGLRAVLCLLRAKKREGSLA